MPVGAAVVEIWHVGGEYFRPLADLMGLHHFKVNRAEVATCGTIVEEDTQGDLLESTTAGTQRGKCGVLAQAVEAAMARVMKGPSKPT